MTREEAIEILSRPKSMNGVPTEILTAHAMAIKALEQEPILDEIRAEIEQEPYVSKMEVLEIIDKYRAESEGKG